MREIPGAGPTLLCGAQLCRDDGARVHRALRANDWTSPAAKRPRSRGESVHFVLASPTVEVEQGIFDAAECVVCFRGSSLGAAPTAFASELRCTKANGAVHDPRRSSRARDFVLDFLDNQPPRARLRNRAQCRCAGRHAGFSKKNATHSRNKSMQAWERVWTCEALVRHEPCWGRQPGGINAD